jgi:hypothetical protein
MLFKLPKLRNLLVIYSLVVAVFFFMFFFLDSFLFWERGGRWGWRAGFRV